MSSRADSNNRTPLRVGAMAHAVVVALACLWQFVTCNAKGSNSRFLPTRARIGENIELDPLALQVTTLRAVASRGLLRGAVVLWRWAWLQRVAQYISARLGLWGAALRHKLVSNKKWPSFLNNQLSRTIILFAAFNFAMGVALVVAPVNVEYIGFQKDMFGWAIAYGVAFLITGLTLGASSLVWPSLTLDQQVWLQTSGFGASLGVTIGWLMLLVVGIVERTGDWTIVIPWFLILWLKSVIFTRYIDLERPIPREMRRLLRSGRT